MTNTTAATHSWSSTATLEEIAAKLRPLKRLVILTHAKPDGDAIGSTLALARTLTRLGVETHPTYLGIWPKRYDPVVGSTPIIHEKHGCWSSPPLSEIDHALILDTGSWNQLADAKAWLLPRTANAILIDHHAHGDPDVAPVRFIETIAAAACQPAARLCTLLLGLKSPAQLPPDIAEPLLLGLATDTGWFRHSNVTADVLHLAADLVAAGARHNWLYQTTEQADEPSRLKLIGRALSSLEYLAGDRAALMHLTKHDLADSGASLDDAGGLTDLPQTTGAVRVAAVLIEVEPNLSKLSLRSKAAEAGSTSLDIDVNKLAQTFGGGGHRHAAGAKIHAPLPQALEQVRAALRTIGQ